MLLICVIVRLWDAIYSELFNNIVLIQFDCVKHAFLEQVLHNV